MMASYSSFLDPNLPPPLQADQSLLISEDSAEGSLLSGSLLELNHTCRPVALVHQGGANKYLRNEGTSLLVQRRSEFGDSAVNRADGSGAVIKQ